MRLFDSSCFSYARSLTMFTLSLKFSARSSASLWISRLSTCDIELDLSPDDAGGFANYFYSESWSLVIDSNEEPVYSDDPVSDFSSFPLNAGLRSSLR